MVRIIFGSRFYNRNYGLIFIGYGIGAFVGTKISASFYDSTGSYVAGYIGSAVLAADCTGSSGKEDDSKDGIRIPS